MGARKVSVGKSDFQGHLRALAMVLFDRPHKPTISCKSSIAIMSVYCTINEILSLISQNLMRSRYSEVVYHACTSTLVYQSAHEILSV